jgi:hypothetical protein
MRRISGLDINGWRDGAARDWEPDEPDVSIEKIRVIDGGIGSVAVQQSSGEWTGGPQALLAPHGRGAGWGALGSPDRRIPIAAVLDEHSAADPERFRVSYAAAVNALARGADDVILGVPDVDDFDEAVRARLLSTFHRDRRSFRLLWRPVAAFLSALEIGAIPKDAVGKLFCFLIHSGSSIDLQTLRLRRDSEHPDHVAPERDGYGRRVLPSIGLRPLKERAHAAVLGANPLLVKRSCEESTLGLRLICGEASAGDTEIVRLHNGNWIEVSAPSVADSDLFTSTDFGADIDVASYSNVAATFLLTPLSEPYSSALSGRLSALFPQLNMLEWSALARGGLRAGRLIERGLPHYFDRLTPISLAVMRRDEPVFDDLVGSEATLPANKEYVSPPYRDLKWLSEKQEVEFYVLKGGDEVRFWSVHLEEGPKHDVPVELRIRQTPGQSWAKLSLTSPEWEPLQRSPIFLDWANLDPIEAAPGEILEKLRMPPPTIPCRIVEPPFLEFWTGGDRVVGINSVLANMALRDRFVPGELAKLLSRSLRDPKTHARVRPVGTDGILPAGLSDQEREAFLDALKRCETEIATAPSRRLQSNDALRCLTWAFTLCPPSVQDGIVAALEADLRSGSHPLLIPRASRKVLTQGAGRAVTGVPRLRRVLRVLTSRSANNDTLTALAMILSRREEAPRALTSTLVAKIVDVISDELAYLIRAQSFQVRFKNTLSAIAGLFRYREVEAFSLLAVRDPEARKLRSGLDEVDALLLERNRQKVRLYDEKKALVASIRDYLNGAGDPNILARIEDLDDEPDNDPE